MHGPNYPHDKQFHRNDWNQSNDISDGTIIAFGINKQIKHQTRCVETKKVLNCPIASLSLNCSFHVNIYIASRFTAQETDLVQIVN